jgi:TRAP-type C4-dicarboxylate transport system permease large subunit
VWFGVLIIVVAEMGMVTPPVGLNCFIVSRYSGRPIAEVFHGTTPHVLAHVAAILLLVVFPQLILWLPSHMQ